MNDNRIEIDGTTVALTVGASLVLGREQMSKLSVEGIAQLTEALRASDLPVHPVDDLRDLDNLSIILRHARNGEDVSVMMAYNGLSLPEGLDEAIAAYKAAREEQDRVSTALEERVEATRARRDELVAQLQGRLEEAILERRRARLNAPADLTKEQLDDLANWEFGPRRIINPDGYGMGLKAARHLWDGAVPLWDARPTTDHSGHLGMVSSVRVSDSSRTAVVYGDYIKIGCQNVPRYVAEHAARHYGWLEAPQPA